MYCTETRRTAQRLLRGGGEEKEGEEEKEEKEGEEEDEKQGEEEVSYLSVCFLTPLVFTSFFFFSPVTTALFCPLGPGLASRLSPALDSGLGLSSSPCNGRPSSVVDLQLDSRFWISEAIVDSDACSWVSGREPASPGWRWLNSGVASSAPRLTCGAFLEAWLIGNTSEAPVFGLLVEAAGVVMAIQPGAGLLAASGSGSGGLLEGLRSRDPALVGRVEVIETSQR